MNRVTLAKLLQTWRRENHLYQKEAAVKPGISRTYYDKLENGKGNPSFDLLSRICRFAKVRFIPVPVDAAGEGDEICRVCKSLKLNLNSY